MKTIRYLKDDNEENKKNKWTKKCPIKQKLKFENYKQHLEANELETKINQLENKKADVDSLIENHKEYLKRIN